MPHLKDVLGQKWQIIDYFQEFHFSESVRHIIDNNVISIFLN